MDPRWGVDRGLASDSQTDFPGDSGLILWVWWILPAPFWRYSLSFSYGKWKSQVISLGFGWSFRTLQYLHLRSNFQYYPIHCKGGSWFYLCLGFLRDLKKPWDLCHCFQITPDFSDCFSKPYLPWLSSVWLLLKKKKIQILQRLSECEIATLCISSRPQTRFLSSQPAQPLWFLVLKLNFFLGAHRKPLTCVVFPNPSCPLSQSNDNRLVFESYCCWEKYRTW